MEIALRSEVSRIVRELRRITGELRAHSRLERGFPGARIDPTVIVRTPELLRIGHGCTIDSGVMLHCGGLGWDPGSGRIHLGSNCYVGPNAVLFGAGGISIGDDVLIGPGVVVTSHQHSFSDRSVPIRSQALEFGEIVIESDVWIGANAVLLPGVTVGAGSVVGAGAVVTTSLPPSVVAVGIPARVIHER